MARLTRDQSRALTRARLLAAAAKLFARDGYATTSVEAIGEEAGFSKGAVYSNFDSKEAIFLAVLDDYGEASLASVRNAVESALDARAAIEAVVTWSDKNSRAGNWPVVILEHARQVGFAAPSRRAGEEIIRSHWRRLGASLAKWTPATPVDSEALGALVYELTYAPMISLVERPTAGDLVRLALGAILTPYGEPA